MMTSGDNAAAQAARAVISQRIRERRAELKLGLAELGRLIDTERQVIAHWERGAQKPREDKMLALAKAMKTSISYLYGETDDPRPAPNWGTNEGPGSAWEAKMEQMRGHLAAMQALLEPEVSPEKAELMRIASTSARGSTLFPGAEKLDELETILGSESGKPTKFKKAKAQGE